MQKRAKVKPQNPIVYTFFYLLLRPYLSLRYGYRRPKDVPARREKEPIVVLGNHASNLDFLYAAVSLYPKRMNFLVSAHFFAQKPLLYVLRFFRCIRKEQFSADVAAIRDMRALVNAGGSILIYPEGEVNGLGMTGDFPASTARLCRLLRAPVYTVRDKGSYLTRPKWGPSVRRGRVECDIECIATKEELAALSDEELVSRIRAGIRQDEYAWQEEAHIRFRSKAPAAGLERLLYLCPRCGAEYRMASEGHDFFCTACGNRARMDEEGFLSPASEDAVVFRKPSDWVEYEREALRTAMASPDFALREKAYLQYHLDETQLKHTNVGEGIVTLDRSGIAYEGTALGESVHLHFPLADLYKLPFAPDKHFELPPAARITAIHPFETRTIWKFVLALPLMKEIAEREAQK